MRHSPLTRAWVIAGTFGLMAGIAQPASAVPASQTFSFTSISGASTSEGLGDNFFVDVDVSGGFGTFTFRNELTTDKPVITGVWFDDEDDLFLNPVCTDDSCTNPFSMTITNDPGNTEFFQDAGNFPQGENINWTTTPVGASSDPNTQPPENGINGGEWLTIGLELAGATTLASILDSINNGSDTPSGLRFGLHVQGIGENAELSDSFVNTPPSVIPIPASLPLFLTGLFGLGFLGRRRRQMADV